MNILTKLESQNTKQEVSNSQLLQQPSTTTTTSRNGNNEASVEASEQGTELSAWSTNISGLSIVDDDEEDATEGGDEDPHKSGGESATLELEEEEARGGSVITVVLDNAVATEANESGTNQVTTSS